MIKQILDWLPKNPKFYPAGTPTQVLQDTAVNIYELLMWNIVPLTVKVVKLSFWVMGVILSQRMGTEVLH